MLPSGAAKTMATDDQHDDDFAQRLRQARHRRDLSQAELAERAQVHYTHVSKYERGRSRPSLDTLERLAQALGVSTDYLLHGADEPITRARFEDDELLRQFQQVQGLAEGDKRLVKEFLQAFLTKRKLEQLVSG